MSPKKAQAIEIQEKLCKQCGICVEFCPAGVFSKKSPQIPVVSSLEACTVCRMCETRCPDYAISVQEVNGK